MINWNANKLDVFIWDVGHGLSVTIITPFVASVAGLRPRRRVIQIDAGVNNEFKFYPISYLVNKCNLQVIDHLILSHADQDHISELPAIMNLVASGKLNLLSVIRNKSFPNTSVSEITLEEKEAKTHYKNINNAYNYPLNAYDILHPLNFGGVQVETRHLHYLETMQEPNNLSVVANIKFGTTQLIVPGDLEEEGANLLINLGWMPAADLTKYRILLAPHHGSRTAKPTKLLKFFKPHIVLASAEKDHEHTDPIYSSPDYVLGHPIEKSNGIEEVSRFSATKGETIHLETYGHYPTIKRIPYTTPEKAVRKALAELLAGIDTAPPRRDFLLSTLLK